MSGGRFAYEDTQLKSTIFGWTDTPKNVFEDREISELVWDVLDLIHAFDWYASGDTGEDDYLREKEVFKRKWFGEREPRVRRIVDDAIRECREELCKTFAIGDNADSQHGEEQEKRR